jgi:hypothetical protein
MWLLAALFMFIPASLANIVLTIFLPLSAIAALLAGYGYNPNPDWLFFYIVGLVIAPVTEEPFRSWSARWTGLVNAPMPTVLAVGATIGVLEFLGKAYLYTGFNPEWLVSIPDQMALTLLSYSLVRYRVPLMVVLHSCLNSFTLFIASQLDAALTGTRYTAALMAVNLATFAIVAIGAILHRRSVYVLR